MSDPVRARLIALRDKWRSSANVFHGVAALRRCADDLDVVIAAYTSGHELPVSVENSTGAAKNIKDLPRTVTHRPALCWCDAHQVFHEYRPVPGDDGQALDEPAARIGGLRMPTVIPSLDRHHQVHCPEFGRYVAKVGSGDCRCEPLASRSAPQEDDNNALLTALPPPQLEANPLQSELLDLIVLMPDAQVDDLVGFITKLRDARRFNTRPQG